MKSNSILSVIIIMLLAALLVLVLRLPCRRPEVSEEVKSWSDKDQLDYANILLSKGLKNEAADAFGEYVEEAKVDRGDLSKVCYRLGNIHMDLFEYEKALVYFYRAEMLDKDSDFRQAMNEKIVAALENLGLTVQAKYEMAQRVSLGSGFKDEGGVIARIGKREIRKGEIDRILNSLPERMVKQFEKGEQRLNFIRDYVASEVLYEKAKRLGLDKKAEIREAVENVKKQMLIQTMLAQEIKKELKIDQDDLENYYKSNQDKYTEPEKIKVSYCQFSQDSEKDNALGFLKEEKGTKLDGWIRRGQKYISGIGDVGESIEGLFLMEKGQVSDSVKIKDKFYVFSIDEKQPSRVKTFNQVKEEVAGEYRSNKERQITDSVLIKALEEQEVEIFYQGQADESKKSN
ncbi:MAG: peptidyl-prolyl cis-trans isomerase [Candidatus Omnitrophota bacterium]